VIGGAGRRTPLPLFSQIAEFRFDFREGVTHPGAFMGSLKGRNAM
jgi:hypothetical protein